MFRQSLLVVLLTLWGAGVLLCPGLAQAETPLNRVIVQRLRNQVRILPKNQSPRSARKSDTLAPGDALSTARQSLAELRFNDNSLARIGEQALFRFVPNTRAFQLNNGTVLLLIPPGRGQTRVRTPNAAAGIRGSALFVRYNPNTETTIVGALTNSQIVVFNHDASQRQELKAGQLAVIVRKRIERVFTFDLQTFYETSELVRDLDLPQRQPTPNPDPAIAQVQQETGEAVRSQAPVQGQGVIENPGFVGLSPPLPQALDDAPAPGSIVPASVDQSPASGVSPVLTGRPTPALPQGPPPVSTTPESILEPVVEPVVDPIVEPVVDPVVDPINEPVVDPVVDPINEPVVDPIPNGETGGNNPGGGNSGGNNSNGVNTERDNLGGTNSNGNNSGGGATERDNLGGTNPNGSNSGGGNSAVTN